MLEIGRRCEGCFGLLCVRMMQGMLRRSVCQPYAPRVWVASLFELEDTQLVNEHRLVVGYKSRF